MHPFRLLLLFSLLLLAVVTHAQDCYTKTRQKGVDAYNAKQYTSAITFWRAAKGCSAVPASNDLDTWIKKANDKIAEEKRRQEEARKAEEKRRQQQAAEAQRKRDQQLKDQTAAEQKKRDAELLRQQREQADETAWKYAQRINTAVAYQIYLDDYPSGKYAATARQKINPPVVTNPVTTETQTQPKEISGFAFIKGGTFQMGDVMGDQEQTDETVHSVTVKDFYMSKHEVTFDEFDAFCTATSRDKPSDQSWGRGKRPVINVDWYDAIEYCNWRSEKEGLEKVYDIEKRLLDPNNQNKADADSKRWYVQVNWNAKGYRLPTEAEWEYAAREGGRKVRFGNGKDIASPLEMNFAAQEDYKKPYSIAGEYRGNTLPVGSFKANSLGLYDMSGNVWEWCSDWYSSDYYAGSANSSNPKGATAGTYRVLRGGGWGAAPRLCRAAYRTYYAPTFRGNTIGFRLAR